MAINETKSPLHWRYLLLLEEDLMLLARYIEFTSDNYDSYSVELGRILLSAGSEVDVVAKQVCQKVDPKTKAKNIGHYRQQLRPAFPQIEHMTFVMPRFGLELCPWSNWQNNKKPLWWDAYNNVKHNRHNKFSEANLKNVLNSIAGLLVLVLHLYHKFAEEGSLSPNPTLFRPTEKYQNGTTVWDTEMLINYRLSG